MWIIWVIAVIILALASYIVFKKLSVKDKGGEVSNSKGEWTADREVLAASDALGRGAFAEAADILKKYLATKPTSADALTLLKQVYWKSGEMAAYHQATLQLVQVHLRVQENDLAYQGFEEYSRTGGTAMPAALWLDIARMLEAQQQFEQAVAEYEALAAAFPTEKQSILALLAAGRLCLKRLHRPADAVRNYEAAANSTVPHLDWETNIQAGLADAQEALGQLPVPEVHTTDE